MPCIIFKELFHHGAAQACLSPKHSMQVHLTITFSHIMVKVRKIFTILAFEECGQIQGQKKQKRRVMTQERRRRRGTFTKT